MILPIPNSLDTLDSVPHTHNSFSEKYKVPKYALIKKRVFLENGYKYRLICDAYWGKDDKRFKLSLMAGAVTSDDEFVLVEENLKYKEVQKVTKHLEYKDVIPVNFQLKQIKNFYTFVKYLLLPFIGVNSEGGDDEDQKQKIEIWAKPPGLLSVLTKISFLNRSCFVNFHHIIGNTFRIVLTEHLAGEEVLRLDMNID